MKAKKLLENIKSFKRFKLRTNNNLGVELVDIGYSSKKIILGYTEKEKYTITTKELIKELENKPDFDVEFSTVEVDKSSPFPNIRKFEIQTEIISKEETIKILKKYQI